MSGRRYTLLAVTVIFVCGYVEFVRVRREIDDLLDSSP